MINYCHLGSSITSPLEQGFYFRAKKMPPKGALTPVRHLGMIEKRSHGWRVVLPRMPELEAKSNTNGPVATKARAKKSLAEARQCGSRLEMIAFVRALRKDVATIHRNNSEQHAGDRSEHSGVNTDLGPAGKLRWRVRKKTKPEDLEWIEDSEGNTNMWPAGKLRWRVRKKTKPEHLEWIATRDISMVGSSQSLTRAEDDTTETMVERSRTCDDATGCGRLLCDTCYPPGLCGRISFGSSS